MTEIDTKIASMQENLNALTLSGDHNITLNADAETNLTLPSSGTLATVENLAGLASQASVNNLKKK